VFFLILAVSATLVASNQPQRAIFPDILAPLYQPWDFRIRSARITGDLVSLEKQHLWLVKTRPFDLGVRWQLVEFYTQCGMTNKIRTAASEYRSLLARSPAWQWNAWNLWFAAARSHDLSGEEAKALELYRTSLRFGATAHAWNRIMELELAAGRHAAAIEACRRWAAISGFPQGDRERVLAVCFERCGNKEYAQAAYLRSLQANPLDLLSLEGLARTGASNSVLVARAVRTVAESGYNLDYLNNGIETCLTAGRPEAARFAVRELAGWFRARRSVYWSMAAARADEAAGCYHDAAMHFRQARLWRPGAPPDETAYYLERELRLLTRAERIPEAVTLFNSLGHILSGETRSLIEIGMMRATNADASLIEGALVGLAAGDNGDWRPLTAALLGRIDELFPDAACREVRGRLWRLCAARNQDPVTRYAAGKFFLEQGLPAVAIGYLHRAREGMRTLGQISVDISVAARLLGLKEDEDWHDSRARYLLGHEAANTGKTVLAQRIRKDLHEAVP